MKVRAMHPQEKSLIKELLDSHALPVSDLDTADIEFLVAVKDENIIGVAGLEIFDKAGLLRSVAVGKDIQTTGVGSALVMAMEQHARQRQLTHLVLLTETAAAYFSNHGYHEIPREQAPVAIQQSGEFRSICPASAVCMMKTLS